MKRNLGVLCVGLCAGVALFAAMCSDETGTGGTPGPSGTLYDSYTYTIVGNTMVYSWPETIETDRWCDGDTLVTDVDTIEAGSDTVPYTLTGNTLVVVEETYSEGSGAVVQLTSTYTRLGSGTGLQGTWNQTDAGYTVVSGQLTPLEQASLDAEVADIRQEIADGFLLQLAIGASTMDIYGSAPWAEMLISEMPIDTADFDITAVAVNNNTARITGNISHEVVTITMSSNGDVTWSSTNSAHARYVARANPTTCPNEFTPSWIDSFLMDNAVAVYKAGAITWSAPRHAAAPKTLGWSR